MEKSSRSKISPKTLSEHFRKSILRTFPVQHHYLRYRWYFTKYIAGGWTVGVEFQRPRIITISSTWNRTKLLRAVYLISAHPFNCIYYTLSFIVMHMNSRWRPCLFPRRKYQSDQKCISHGEKASMLRYAGRVKNVSPNFHPKVEFQIRFIVMNANLFDFFFSKQFMGP